LGKQNAFNETLLLFPKLGLGKEEGLLPQAGALERGGVLSQAGAWERGGLTSPSWGLGKQNAFNNMEL